MSLISSSEILTPIDAKEATNLSNKFREKARDARTRIAELHRQIRVTEQEALTWQEAADEIDLMISGAIKNRYPCVAKF